MAHRQLNAACRKTTATFVGSSCLVLLCSTHATELFLPICDFDSWINFLKAAEKQIKIPILSQALGIWCGRNIEFFFQIEMTRPWVLTEVTAITSALQFSRSYKAGCNSKAAMLALQMCSGVKLIILILAFTHRRATICLTYRQWADIHSIL